MRRKSRHTEVPSSERIIRDADAELLRAFLIEETRRNASLELKLRAHLAADLDEHAYHEILSQIVKHNVQGTIRLTRRSIHLLKEIAQRFVHDQEQFLRDRELRRAWDAGSAVIAHLHLLMDKYHGPEPKLVAILSEAYKNALATLLAKPAPELKRRMAEDLLDLLRRPHHIVYDLHANAAVVLQMSDESTRNASIEAVLHKLTDHELPEEQHKKWSAVFLALDASDHEIRNAIRGEDAYDIAHLLQSPESIHALAKLLRTFPPPASLTSKQFQQWARWRFDSMVALGSAKDIHEAGMHLLELTQDISTYRRIKDAASAFVVTNYAGITEDLHADILAAESEWTALAHLLKEQSLLPALVRHAIALHYQIEDPLALFASVSITYADAHGGPKTLELITNLLDVLKSSGFGKTADLLSNQLADAFPDRFATIRKTARKRNRNTPSMIPQEEEE